MVARRNSTSLTCYSIHIGIFGAKWLDHHKAIPESDDTNQPLVHRESLAIGKATLTTHSHRARVSVPDWHAYLWDVKMERDSSSKINSGTYRQTFVGDFQTLSRIPQNKNKQKIFKHFATWGLKHPSQYCERKLKCGFSESDSIRNTGLMTKGK